MADARGALNRTEGNRVAASVAPGIAGPLVIDQPEDDLDNRFITEGVVPRMNDEKRRRQVVFATHNANIPVLGDAELIVGLSATGEADQGRAKLKALITQNIDNLR